MSSEVEKNPVTIDDVDPFIGIDGPGATLCGPYHPLGLVRLGPDTVAPHRTNGYRSDFPLQGFSHTHVSGTGGEGRFGNVSLTPFVGPATLSPGSFERVDEAAKLGRYEVTLQPGKTKVSLTASPRCGVSRFVFPAGEQANLLIDASAVHKVHPKAGAQCIGGSIEWTDDLSFMGYGSFRGGWGHEYPYHVFFYGKIDASPDYLLFSQNEIRSSHSNFVSGSDSKCVASWEARSRGEIEVEARIGISFVSISNARANFENEVANESFETIEKQNRLAWEKWFDRIQVLGGSEEQRRIFATFITRLLCMPSDLGVDDEYAYWKSGVRHFSEFYALWDSVRNANSLITLFAPELQRDFLNCLLDIADKRSWFPDAWITGHSAKIQGGSSADILFNEAHLKGLDGIDYEKALGFMRKNNEVVSPDPYLFGRYLEHYRDLGFVSTDTMNCVSRHLEYAYQDWCIGSLAERLSDIETSQTFYRSAKKVWNLWSEELQHFAPKDNAGKWASPFDINVCRKDSWNDPYFYEGVSRSWTYNVQADFAGLVARCGGEVGFEQHLDRYFEDKKIIAKETFMHIPYLYHYANRPDKSSKIVRRILSKAYKPERFGIPDNEDMGCHSAFYICGLLGIYPMMGQDWYFLVAPAFERSVITLGQSGAELIIEAQKASDKNVYIESASLNGARLDRAWIRHEEIKHGAVLSFSLSSSETDWGRHNPPPSPLSS